MIGTLLIWSELMTKLKKSSHKLNWLKLKLLTSKIALKTLLHKFL